MFSPSPKRQHELLTPLQFRWPWQGRKSDRHDRGANGTPFECWIGSSQGMSGGVGQPVNLLRRCIQCQVPVENHQAAGTLQALGELSTRIGYRATKGTVIGLKYRLGSIEPLKEPIEGFSRRVDAPLLHILNRRPDEFWAGAKIVIPVCRIGFTVYPRVRPRAQGAGVVVFENLHRLSDAMNSHTTS